MQTAFQEEQALLRQEALIAEEEAAQRAKSLRQARRAEADRERRAKKKVLARWPCLPCMQERPHSRCSQYSLLLKCCLCATHICACVLPICTLPRLLQLLQKKREAREGKEPADAQPATFLPTYDSAQAAQLDDDSGEHSAADHDTVDSDRWQSARSTSASLLTHNGFNASRQASAGSHQLNGHVRSGVDGSQSCSTSGGHKHGEAADSSSCASFMSTDTANVDQEDSDEGGWVAVGNNGKARRPDLRAMAVSVATANGSGKGAPSRNGLHPHNHAQAQPHQPARAHGARAASQAVQHDSAPSTSPRRSAEPAALDTAPAPANSYQSAARLPSSHADTSRSRGGYSTPAAAAAAAQAAIEGANAAPPARTAHGASARPSSGGSTQGGADAAASAPASGHVEPGDEVELLRQQLHEARVSGARQAQELHAQLDAARRTLAARDAEIATLKQQLVAATTESMTPRAPRAALARTSVETPVSRQADGVQHVPFVHADSQRGESSEAAMQHHSLPHHQSMPQPSPPSRVETRGLPIVRPRATVPPASSAGPALVPLPVASSPPGQQHSGNTPSDGLNASVSLSPHHAMQAAALRAAQMAPNASSRDAAGHIGALTHMALQPAQRQSPAASNPALSHTSAWAGGAPPGNSSGQAFRVASAFGPSEAAGAPHRQAVQQHSSMNVAGNTDNAHQQAQAPPEQAQPASMPPNAASRQVCNRHACAEQLRIYRMLPTNPLVVCMHAHMRLF